MSGGRTVRNTLLSRDLYIYQGTTTINVVGAEINTRAPTSFSSGDTHSSTSPMSLHQSPAIIASLPLQTPPAVPFIICPQRTTEPGKSTSTSSTRTTPATRSTNTSHTANTDARCEHVDDYDPSVDCCHSLVRVRYCGHDNSTLTANEDRPSRLRPGGNERCRIKCIQVRERTYIHSM